jgi:hypothetical protein
MSSRDRRRPRPLARATVSARVRPAASAPPPTWRDPWAWCSAASILPLLATCAGAPLGEPAAEDFDFLHRALFGGLGSLLDGGGSQAFWRPLAHQVYYATLGRLIVAHPLAVAALHALLLATAALLLYRVFRPALDGPGAAVAASFPVLAESTRLMLGWPTTFVDLGLLVFSALALHETSRRRLATALAALLAALLCKEAAVVTAVMMPLLPGRWEPRGRARWTVATAALTAAWAVVALGVRHAAHLALPHAAGRLVAQDVSLLGRLGWALGGSLRAMASLALVNEPHAVLAAVGAVALALVAAGWLVVSPAARARLAARRAWLAWGSGWFLLASVTFVPMYPYWGPHRAVYGGVGLGVASVTVLSSAHPALGVALAGGRLAMLALAPAAARATSGEPPETGAFMDFAHLTRLQHFLRETRVELRRSHPTLPPRSRVLFMAMPHQVVYSFGGSRAVQVWYGDPTLESLTFDAFQRQSDLPFTCALAYQPETPDEVVALPPDAVRAQESGHALLQRGHPAEALAVLAHADSLVSDPRAVVFRAGDTALRALASEALGRDREARRLALDALALYRHTPLARLVLGKQAMLVGDLDAAQAQIDSALADDPRQRDVLRLRAFLDELRRGVPGPR